jgi:hypothetical protein
VTDSIDVSIEDVMREMDPQTKLGWELAHQKAVNRILVRMLAESENAKQENDGSSE